MNETKLEEAIDQINKELMNILELSTCDDSLFHDGINLEIEACARNGLLAFDKAVQELKGLKLVKYNYD